MFLMEIKVPFSWLRQTSDVSIVAWFEQLRKTYEVDWFWYDGTQDKFAFIYVKVNDFSDFERIRDDLFSCLDQQPAYRCRYSPTFSLVPVPHVRVVTDTSPHFVVAVFFYEQSLRVAVFPVKNGDCNTDVRRFGV